MHWQREDFSISTSRNQLDIDFIHDYLCHQSYWAQGRSREIVEKSIRHSLCFGIYQGERQIGFGRVVTDYCTFAWLCDVFVVSSYQGQGLGKWLIECVNAHPDLQQQKYILLATRDAHEFYRRYGNFEKLNATDKWMVRYRNSS